MIKGLFQQLDTNGGMDMAQKATSESNAEAESGFLGNLMEIMTPSKKPEAGKEGVIELPVESTDEAVLPEDGADTTRVEAGEESSTEISNQPSWIAEKDYARIPLQRVNSTETSGEEHSVTLSESAVEPEEVQSEGNPEQQDPGLNDTGANVGSVTESDRTILEDQQTPKQTLAVETDAEMNAAEPEHETIEFSATTRTPAEGESQQEEYVPGVQQEHNRAQSITESEGDQFKDNTNDSSGRTIIQEEEGKEQATTSTSTKTMNTEVRNPNEVLAKNEREPQSGSGFIQESQNPGSEPMLEYQAVQDQEPVPASALAGTMPNEPQIAEEVQAQQAAVPIAEQQTGTKRTDKTGANSLSSQTAGSGVPTDGSRSERMEPVLLNRTPVDEPRLRSDVPQQVELIESDSDTGSTLTAEQLDMVQDMLVHSEELEVPSDNKSSSSGMLRLLELPITQVALRERVLPVLSQTVQQLAKDQPQHPEGWQKHTFELEDGNQLELTTRTVDGVLQVRLATSNIELAKTLQQYSEEIQQRLESEMEVEVDLQFDQSAEQEGSFAEQAGFDPSSRFGARGISSSTPSSSSPTTPTIEPGIRQFGYNRMEWTA